VNVQQTGLPTGHRVVRALFWLQDMPSLAAFPRMLERDRRREGLRVCRAAWLLGLTVREYRALEAGGFPTSEVYERICDLFGWPQTFAVGGSAARKPGR
jgi:hypothetical protein